MLSSYSINNRRDKTLDHTLRISNIIDSHSQLAPPGRTPWLVCLLHLSSTDKKRKWLFCEWSTSCKDNIFKTEGKSKCWLMNIYKQKSFFGFKMSFLFLKYIYPAISRFIEYVLFPTNYSKRLYTYYSIYSWK